MGIISNKKKAVLGSCLMIGQLLTASVTWAKSAQMDMGLGDPEVRAQVKNKNTDRSSDRTKSILMNLPSDGEIQIQGGLGYLASTTNMSTPVPYGGIYMPQLFNTGATSSSSEETGFTSQISASYGLTDHFYGSLKLGYSSSSEKGVSRNANNFVMSETTIKTDGIKDPSLLVGAQGMMGATRLFAEVSVDVSLGDRNVSRSGYSNDWTDNNLRGGMAYSPRIGLIQDLGSVLLYTGASYTIRDARVKKTSDNFTNVTTRTTGGNSLQLLAGTEFKELSRLGVTLGYVKSESEEMLNQQFMSTTKTPSLSQFVTMVHAGIKVSEGTTLIPVLSYATVLERDMVLSDGILRNIDRAEVWGFTMSARMAF